MAAFSRFRSGRRSSFFGFVGSVALCRGENAAASLGFAQVVPDVTAMQGAAESFRGGVPTPAERHSASKTNSRASLSGVFSIHRAEAQPFLRRGNHARWRSGGAFAP